MSKERVYGRALLVLLATAGLSGCSSNPGKSDGAQSAVPAPATQAENSVAVPQTVPAAQMNQQARPAKKGSKTAKAEQPTPPVQAAQPVAAAQPAAPAPETPSGKIGPGMNSKGEVVDSSKVEAGYGQAVKGLRDWEGEITGKPAPGSKFTQLKIGMPMKQVTDLVGQPSDQGAYITGKAFIPFFFGSDKHRQELVYKNQGRLIFAGGSMGDFGSAHLVWIIHNASEPAYR